MKITDSFTRAGRSLRSAKGRTLLTSLAIAVGAFTLALSLALGEGARRYANELITSNMDPQVISVVKDPNMYSVNGGAGGLKEYSENSVTMGSIKFKALDTEDLEKIANTKNVEKVIPYYMVNPQYVMFEGNPKKYSVDVSMYDATVIPPTAAGKLPTLGQQIDDNEIVMPESFLNSLNVKNPSDMVGKRITLHIIQSGKQPSQAEIEQLFATEGLEGLTRLGQKQSKDVTYTIRAVSAKSSTSMTASNGLFVSEAQAKELSEYMTKGTDQYQKYLTASAAVKKGVDPASVANALNKQGLTAKTAKDLQKLIFTFVNLLQAIVAGFGILALIASIFGIINTQYIAVLERTREIGLMKALGMRGRHVSRLFQLEAAWIGLLGGIIGVGLALLVGNLLNPVITKQLSLGYNNLIVFQPLALILLILTLMLIAMSAGWLPARKASKLDPIEALRTE